MRRNLSRRGFAAIVAGAGSLAAQQQPAPPPNPNTSLQPQERRQGTLDEVPPFKDPIQFARNPVAPKVEPFPMTQVRLLPGPFLDAAEWNRGYMNRLAADRLLHNFRLNAGLDSKAEPLGGWEVYVAPTPGQPRRNSEGELRGHFTGHFLSASAQLYASMGDKEAKSKGDYMVAELARCQEKLGAGGYLSAFPTEWFDRLDARRPVWAPFYTIHKIMAGMFDMYQLAGNKQALTVLEGMSNWADEWTRSKSEEHMQDILNTEYGGMNDILYKLAAATGNDRWAAAGDRFTKKRFFNPLALRRDELTGLHVNTHIPQVIGAAQRYEISGDMRFHDVADYFWYEVATARSYVTEGTSNGEGWLAQPRMLASELKRSVATAECCCSYNMLKLTRHLYGWKGDPGYFDYYERALFNHRLGTIQPKTGFTQYYLSLTPGAWKTFNTEDKSFWCCTGSGVEEYSKLNDSIYWRDEDGVLVNLFIPSELNWEEKGFRLRQETRFPEQQTTSLTVTAARPASMALKLRVPAWTRSASVKVNGRAIDVTPTPGSYLTLTRSWKTGDRIEMTLPMRLTVESMPDDPKTQAFLYGPIVLAGDLGSEGLTEQMIVGPNAPRPQRVPLEVPTFKAANAGPSSWIKPAGAPLSFRTTGQSKDVTLVPLNSIFGARYSVYWQVG
ncbi:MAG TPA: beta-L-arabinofuranosidase domain-containing protein [Verrucomicrobiae bacterium]|nr:beta-L-arabinofuranosidase domain-containing protein [Verrucomicrobiae bacterium]